MVLGGFYPLGMPSVFIFCFGFGVVGGFVVVVFVVDWFLLFVCSGFLFGLLGLFVFLLTSNLKISFSIKRIPSK